MRTFLATVVALLLAITEARAQTPAGDTLDIYVVDVEGGNATLLVSPSGESLLIDTGNGGAAADRDVGRIMAAIEDAGVDAIDHLITTHWHGDHFGGMTELASRIPIRNFIDHGPSVQSAPATDAFLETYPRLRDGAQHTVVQPGDTIAVNGLDIHVLASGGRVIGRSVTSESGPNPYCGEFSPQAEDTGENAQSVGVLITFGAFRALHLGDLTVNTEFDLMCPNNPMGTVDLFVVSHHGQPTSNAPVLVHAIAPRVGIVNNGTRKGGQPEAMRVLHSAPGLEDLWQLHFSVLSGQEHTVPGLFIANDVDQPLTAMPIRGIANPGRGAGVPPPPVHNGQAYWVKASGSRDGSFTITNSRNGFSKMYEARTD